MSRDAPPQRTLLGGRSARAFLADYWQKRPLVVRGAWPRFADPVSVSDLFRLAARADCESRLVIRDGARWRLEPGPLRPGRARRLPARRWTLLVQGLNHFVPDADRLLRAFRFVPYARLDDVMVSYAAPGGGVGPHFDSYDVFLLQGRGRRRWRIAQRGDPELDARAPLKVLRRFRPEEEWVLEPGDMLYLPPGIAHEGSALEPCLTYSIGFRAPSSRELAVAFLAFLEDRLDPGSERYADPDLRPARRPAALDDALVSAVPRCLPPSGGRAAISRRFSARTFPSPSRMCDSSRRRGRWGAAHSSGGRSRRHSPCGRERDALPARGRLPERRADRGRGANPPGPRAARERARAPPRDFGHAGGSRPALHLVSGRVDSPSGRRRRVWMTSRKYCRNPSGS